MFAIAVALIPQAAAAHAQLLQSDPAPGSLLESAPAAVTLVFSEAVTPAGTGIQVFSPSGAQVAGRAHVDGAALAAPVRASETGTYVVSWQVLAADTHPSRGIFAFSVGRRGPNPFSALLDSGSAGTATPLGLALQALARWIHFAGYALAFGVAAYLTAFAGAARLRPLIGAGVALLIVAEPLSLLAQLASLSFDGDTALAVLGSNFGRLLGLRLGAALVAWTVLATGRSWPLLVIGAADAIVDGASAHAIAGLPAAGGLLAAVHVAAMGLWIGGLVGYVRAPDRRFGRYALWSAGTAVATGLALAIAHTHLGGALWSTDYGRALVLKVLIVVAALAAALLRRHRPELAVGALAIGAAALVAALPNPF
jgi:copper transport protein